MVDSNSNFVEWGLYQKVCNKLQESKDLQTLSTTFGRLTSDEERVQFVLNLGVVEEIVSIKPCYIPKSSAQSRDLRTDGNKLFKNKQFKESLEKYNQSVLSAPSDDTHTISLAYANRSAVLFHLGRYELCLQDIQTAIDYNYPKEMIYKVLERRGKCYSSLGKVKEAAMAFSEALEYVKSSILKDKEMTQWKNMLVKKLKQFSDGSMNDVSKPAGTMCDGHPVIPKLTSVSDKYIATSKSFDITMSTLKGRYPVALQDIDIGEVLVVEKPFASVLMEDCQSTHCHHCLNRTVVAMPCIHCQSVRYCSQQCAQDSWSQYHSIECKYLDCIYQAGKYGHLALRTLIKAGLEKCKDMSNSNGESSDLKQLGLNSSGVYDPSDYNTIYYLEGHTKSRTVGDLFRRTVIAVYLLKCIQQTEFFSKDDCTQQGGSSKQGNSLVVAGGIVLRHLQSFPCNAHEISELQLCLKSVETSVTKEIGAGIYATMSLFNHSCDPNVIRCFYGDKCVVRALTSITAGQEIADNYGVLSAVTPRSERQKTLASQYYFTCDCQACQQDFPLYFDIATIEQPTFRCDYCGFALPAEKQQSYCLNCKKEKNISFKIKLLDKSEQRLKEAIDKLFHGDVANSLPHIQSHLRILEKNVIPPWKGFNSCKELLKQCYNILSNCNIIDN